MPHASCCAVHSSLFRVGRRELVGSVAWAERTRPHQEFCQPWQISATAHGTHAGRQPNDTMSSCDSFSCRSILLLRHPRLSQPPYATSGPDVGLLPPSDAQDGESSPKPLYLACPVTALLVFLLSAVGSAAGARWFIAHFKVRRRRPGSQCRRAGAAALRTSAARRTAGYPPGPNSALPCHPPLLRLRNRGFQRH